MTPNDDPLAPQFDDIYDYVRTHPHAEVAETLERFNLTKQELRRVLDHFRDRLLYSPTPPQE